jgi:hypothetical protein
MRFTLIILLTFSIFSAYGQADSPYVQDIAALHALIQKTPSYKAQVKGKDLNDYNKLYEQLRNDKVDNISSYKYFYNLSQLILPLRDNHLGFYQLPNSDNFKNKEAIAKFVSSKEFEEYPKYEINLDSLKLALTNKPLESVEGIYHYDKFYSVGLFRKSEKEYIGVVTDSDVPHWRKGQIAIHLYEYSPNYFKAIYGHSFTKHFLLQTNEKYIYHSLVNSKFYASYSDAIYTKTIRKTDYVNLPEKSLNYQLKNVAKDIQYLLVKNFSNYSKEVQRSNAFYDSIKYTLTAPNLIFDLRNNEGGAQKVSKKYLGLIKKYAKKGKVYVLVNNGTISEGERLVLQLVRLPHVTTLGQITRGNISYGNNYDNRIKLPSQKFEVYPTDMKGKGNYLKYENYGIKPAIFLEDTRDWIEQTIDIIKRK